MSHIPLLLNDPLQGYDTVMAGRFMKTGDNIPIFVSGEPFH